MSYSLRRRVISTYDSTLFLFLQVLFEDIIAKFKRVFFYKSTKNSEKSNTFLNFCLLKSSLYISIIFIVPVLYLKTEGTL